MTGLYGAAEMGRILESRGVQIEFLLDEGLTVADGFVPGLSVPMAGYVQYNTRN